MSEAVSSTSEVKTAEMLKESQEAFNLLAQGKRNMLCGEMPEAINQLQEACRKLAEIHGETADQCGDAYFTYGKALLEMARMETGVLGNALQGMSDEEEEESESSESKEEEEKLSAKEKEDISDKIIEAMEETDEEAKTRLEKEQKMNREAKVNGNTKENSEAKEKDEAKENSDKKENGYHKEEEVAMETESAENKEESVVESEDIGDESQEESQEEDEKSQEEGENSQDEEEKSQDDDDDKKTVDGDVSNLQLSWEMLELSKNIFMKCVEEPEVKVKLAEINLRLGEVGLESEQYEQAVGDFQECLKIQKECLEASDRALAETCYQLGLTYTFKADYDDAVKYYQEAASIMEAKIAKLEEVVAEGEKSGKGKDVASADNPVVLAQKEIAELKEIIPDIMGKIEDVKDEQKSGETVKKMLKDSLAAQIGGAPAPSSSTSTTEGANAFGEASLSSKAVVSDISHLVRKKRKTEDDADEEEAKKPKVEENGDAAATNGHSTGKATENIKTKTVEDVKMAVESSSA